MDQHSKQPKQLILLHFNDLVINKPLIFSPFQLFDKTVKSELEGAVPKAVPSKKRRSNLERL